MSRKYAEQLSNETGNEMIIPGEKITRTPVEGSPFWLITDNEKEETWIVFGEYRLTQEPFEDESEASAYIHENTFNLIMNMIIIIQEVNKKQSTK